MTAWVVVLVHRVQVKYDNDDIITYLVVQATKDLQDIDEKRKKEFKNYELEKEHLRRKELERMDEKHRAEAEKKFDEQKKKHADHPKLHHPV